MLHAIAMMTSVVQRIEKLSNAQANGSVATVATAAN